MLKLVKHFAVGAVLVGAVAVLWVLRSLRQAWIKPPNIARAVSGLLAGIVWIDLLAVADAGREMWAAYQAAVSSLRDSSIMSDADASKLYRLTQLAELLEPLRCQQLTTAAHPFDAGEDV